MQEEIENKISLSSVQELKWGEMTPAHVVQEKIQAVSWSLITNSLEI